MTGGFRSFVHKEMRHILRDKRTMSIVLLIPIIQLLLFGFAISVEINNIDFAVCAPHRSEAIRQQIERVEANPYFTFKGYVTSDRIDDLLRRGEVNAVICYAPDYERRMSNDVERGDAIQIIFDASNPNDASAGSGYLRNLLQSSTQTASIMPELHLLYNPQMKSAYQFVPGIMGMIFIIICAMMTSASIVREKETGTMEILLVSPVKPLWIVFAKMIPYLLLSGIDLASILLLARYVLGVPMSSVGGMVILSLLYLILALAIGLFISTFTNRQATALIISAMLLLMPIIMLSGMIFPIENMPDILQWISCVVPTRWYIAAMRKLMIEGLPFIAIWQEFSILTGMTVFLIIVALKKFNDKLE